MGLGLFGGVYCVIMLVRLAVGFAIEGAPDWFGYPIPTVFHLVLASFLLVMGNFHRREVMARSSPR